LNGEYSFNQEKAEIDLVGLLNDIQPFNNNDIPNAA